MAQMGHWLAGLHNALKDYSPPGVTKKGAPAIHVLDSHAALKELYAQVRKDPARNDFFTVWFRKNYRFLMMQFEALKQSGVENMYKSEPWMVIHGDFTFPNVLFDDHQDRLRVLLDWERSRVHPRFEDFKNLLTVVDPMYGRIYRRSDLEAVIKAYQQNSISPLSENEVRGIIEVLRATFLNEFTFWLLKCQDVLHTGPTVKFVNVERNFRDFVNDFPDNVRTAREVKKLGNRSPLLPDKRDLTRRLPEAIMPLELRGIPYKKMVADELARLDWSRRTDVPEEHWELMARGLEETGDSQAAAKLRWMGRAGLLKGAPLKSCLATTIIKDGREYILVSTYYPAYSTLLETALSLGHEIRALATHGEEFNLTDEQNSEREVVLRQWLELVNRAADSSEAYFFKHDLLQSKFIAKAFKGIQNFDSSQLTIFVIVGCNTFSQVLGSHLSFLKANIEGIYFSVIGNSHIASLEIVNVNGNYGDVIGFLNKYWPHLFILIMLTIPFFVVGKVFTAFNTTKFRLRPGTVANSFNNFRFIRTAVTQLFYSMDTQLDWLNRHGFINEAVQMKIIDLISYIS